MSSHAQGAGWHGFGGWVGQFLGTHQNRVDSKGRVSIPAPFRAALRDAEAPEGRPLVLRPSHKHACVEGWPAPVFSALAGQLDALDLFSEAHDDLAASLYADAYPVEPDREGRIVLPAVLAEHAGLTDGVVFLGLGRTFQIWEPDASRRRVAEARERARALSLGAAA